MWLCWGCEIMSIVKKIIRKEVESCSDCPYCEYDACYDIGRDSGYDCKLIGRRIIDDWEWDNTNNPNCLSKSVEKIPIPDWCPLETADGLYDDIINMIEKLVDDKIRDGKYMYRIKKGKEKCFWKGYVSALWWLKKDIEEIKKGHIWWWGEDGGGE